MELIETENVDRDTSFSGQAAAIIRRRILEGEYAPGQRLVEVELASSLNVSRAPIREALRGLEKEGLVGHKPARGFFVPIITLDDAHGLYELREALETAVARLAAVRITETEQSSLSRGLERTRRLIESGDPIPYPHALDFHWTLIEAAKSPLLAKRARETNQQVQILRQRSAYSVDRAAEALSEHLVIAHAVLKRDADAAEKAMREHQVASRESALAAVERFLGES